MIEEETSFATLLAQAMDAANINSQRLAGQILKPDSQVAISSRLVDR